MGTFAERLRSFRIEAKFSQKELAEKVGISFSAYNKYETKGSEPKIDILIKLASVLHCSVDELIGYSSGIKAKNCSFKNERGKTMNKAQFKGFKELLTSMVGSFVIVRSIAEQMDENEEHSIKIVDPYLSMLETMTTAMRDFKAKVKEEKYSDSEKEEILRWLHSVGHAEDTKEDVSGYFEYRPGQLLEAALKNVRRFNDFDRWQHIQWVIDSEISFELAMKINGILRENRIDVFNIGRARE